MNRLKITALRATAALACLIAIAACSNNGGARVGPPAPGDGQAIRSGAEATGVRNTIYVADFKWGNVDIFDKNQLAGQIWDGIGNGDAAYGLAVDPALNLYVGNMDSESVIVYPATPELWG